MNTTTSNLKVIGFSVPVTYAERINAITRRERRTKRAIFEAMVDLYEETIRKREQAFDALVTRAIAEAEEEKRTNPKTPGELLTEFQRLSEAGRREAEALGIDVRDEEALNTLIYAEREARRRAR
jgi:hypothetical protein